MRPPEWKQNVLLLTNDYSIKDLISSAFGEETTLTHVETEEDAFQCLEEKKYEVFLLDQKTTDSPKGGNLKKEDQTFFLEFVQFATQMNPEVITILIANKISANQGQFAIKSGLSLLLDRQSISLNKMIYVVRVLRKRTFRTIKTFDISSTASFSSPLYHFLPTNNRYVPFIKAGESLNKDKREILEKSNILDLYAPRKEFPLIIEELKNSKRNHAILLTEELSLIREKYIQILFHFFNLSTDSHVNLGKKLLEQGKKISSVFENLIKYFDTPYEALQHLPYPRWSEIAHAINGAFYTLIFAKNLDVYPMDEIIFGSLIHNIGTSEINQSILGKNENELNEEELNEYKKHIPLGLEILKRKSIPVSEAIENIILFHHERFDGNGFPKKLKLDQIPTEATLVSIAHSYDYFYSISPGKSRTTPKEAWENLKYAELGQSTEKFDPEIIEKINPIFE